MHAKIAERLGIGDDPKTISEEEGVGLTKVYEIRKMLARGASFSAQSPLSIGGGR